LAHAAVKAKVSAAATVRLARAALLASLPTTTRLRGGSRWLVVEGREVVAAMWNSGTGGSPVAGRCDVIESHRPRLSQPSTWVANEQGSMGPDASSGELHQRSPTRTTPHS
jgi:hypothetical protein